MIISMNLGKDSYDIALERACLAKAGELLDLNRKVMVVTDEGVPSIYSETILRQCGTGFLHRIPGGETSKSLQELERILLHMLENDFTRKDCVVAVGGGVVGDLAGFAASCYMRGIDFYNIPTTVLSQVDSSIGGKTAVNLGGVKNIAGSFYQPKKVLIDPDTLSTLPERQISAGLAEAVKMGLIADPALFALFETADPTAHLDEIIRASLMIKKQIVEQDVQEADVRRALNFGHTIGHGIESVTGLYHGECVALGMIPLCAEDVRTRLVPVLQKLQLPTEVRADRQHVYQAMLHDKKAAGGKLTVVYVESPGSFALCPTDPEDLKESIAMIVKEDPAL
ncbi:MAG: 3-dehydroquinate synthase [Lachnospiraceae bacterium]|nr:3-dehydroquinate synthase [Lachnospiraceae bacterium]